MRLPVPLSLSILLLAGCQAAPPPAQAIAPLPVVFQLTDSTGPYVSAVSTYASGQVVDIDPTFDTEISLIGTDMTNVRLDRIRVTSYTPACDDRPVPELYRTKVIVFPDAVTEAPPTPTRIGYRLPLSTRTLMDLGLCNAQRPQTGTISIRADLASPGRPLSSADLLLRVGAGG